jgi:Leucine-rich repeat (LRR) protein
VNGTIASTDDAYITNVIGTHLAGKVNADVTTVDTRPIITRYFPRLLDLYFPKIDTIYFEGGMYELHKEDLATVPNLQKLYMSFNHLEHLEKDLFINNPKIYFIFFETNNIKHVDPNVFDSLTSLTTLSLYRNNCISQRQASNRNAVLALITSIRNACGPNANPQVQEISDLQVELEKVTLTNGNLTTKCAGSLFSKSTGSIIQA